MNRENHELMRGEFLYSYIHPSGRRVVKVNYGLVLMVIILIGSPVILVFGWKLNHLAVSGQRLGDAPELSLGGDTKPGITMEQQTSADNWTYFSSTYLVSVDGTFDFDSGSILYISVPYSAEDSVSLVDLRLDGGVITAYLLKEDKGLPGIQPASKITYIVHMNITTEIRSFVAVSYNSMSNVLVQMFVILDILLVVRLVYLGVMRRDLTFREFVSFLKFE